MFGIFELFFLLISHSALASNNPHHDTTSPEFKQKAKETYAKVLSCLQHTWTAEKKLTKMEFPADAEAHFQHIKDVTEAYRYPPMYVHPDGYKGPWSENIFISNYFNKSLHFFNGFIPLFIPWADSGASIKYIDAELSAVLRPSVIYFAISWVDEGLAFIGDHYQNIFTISDAGYGHVIGANIKGKCVRHVNKYFVMCVL